MKDGSLGFRVGTPFYLVLAQSFNAENSVIRKHKKYEL